MSTIRFGWAAETIEQDASGVRVTITEDDGRRRARRWRPITSSAATARHSLVREQVGIERGGADFDQIMVLAVFRSKELHEGLKRFPDALHLQRRSIPSSKAIGNSSAASTSARAGSSMRRCRRARPRDNYDFHASAPASRRLSRSPANSIMSASGICASRSPRRIRSAASSSPATPRTAIRPMAASASTTGSRTSSISAGSSRRSCKAGAATRCSRPTARSGGRSSRRPARTSSKPASMRSPIPATLQPGTGRAEFERAWQERINSSAPAF